MVCQNIFDARTHNERTCSFIVEGTQADEVRPLACQRNIETRHNVHDIDSIVDLADG